MGGAPCPPAPPDVQRDLAGLVEPRMSALQQTKQPLMSEITIRGATPADAAAVGEIFGHHVIHGVATFETVPPDEAEMTARIERVLGAGWPWLVAVDSAGEIIG